MTDLTNALDFAAETLTRVGDTASDEAQVVVDRSTLFEVEFDNDGVQLVRDNTDERTSLTVFVEQRKGQASLNGRDSDDVALAIEMAVSGAGTGESDAANTLPSGIDEGAYSFGPTDVDSDAVAAAVERFLGDLNSNWPRIRLAPSHYSFHAHDVGLASSNGARLAERRSYYSFAAMFSGRDGDDTTSFNYTSGASFDPFEDLLQAGALESLFSATDRSFQPKPIPEKFVGTLIMTPPAAAELFGSFYQSLSGLTLVGGLSPYVDRIGEQIASECVTIRNGATDASIPLGGAFDDYGLAPTDEAFVERGELKSFLIDFYSSRKLDLPYTSGNLCPIVETGAKSIDEIIAETDRGILLGRFSGGRPNVQLDISGIAKNSFYVENGEVRYPLVETMISCNFQELLKNIVAISSVAVDYGGSRYPHIAADGVTILTG